MKFFLSLLIALVTINVVHAQDPDQYFVRLVKIEIEPEALTPYTELLNQQMNAAVKLEEGVLEYRVVNEKENPHRFTLIEIYRDHDAYLSHLKTPHFLKYKTSTQDMVESLELIDANLIGRTIKDGVMGCDVALDKMGASATVRYNLNNKTAILL